MIKIIKRYITSCLIAVMLVSSLAGCGEASDDGKKDNITLESPVGVAAEYEIVAERNMYSVDVYPSSVNPVVTEYSFAKGQTFKKYGVTPGGEVNPGDKLVYSETKSLDRQISDMEEEIADMESYHAIQVDGFNKDIYDAKQSEYKAASEFGDVLQFEPEENSDFYSMWAAGAQMPEGAYRRAVQNRERLEQNLKQNEELYNLEHEYKLGNIQRLIDKVTDATVVSDVKGEVVACNYYYSGDQIQKDSPVIAVGDTTRRVLQTEYISKSNISKALDIYAIIDGKRYELEYVNMDPEEYRQLNEAGESVYTTFNLIDPNEEVKIGTYAAVVVEKDRRTGVPCVPNDAVKKEADGYYVYLYDGNETSYVPVEIGMRDGLYAEILSGVSLGDKVLSTQAPRKTNNTAQVTKGDYSISTEMNGFLYYPFTEWVTNPAENGTTYLKEVFVANDEKVEKDQVLATVEVIPDQIEIDRLNRQISRLESRLAKLKVKKYDYDARKIIDRSLEREIAEDEREINQKKRSLEKLGKYSGIVEIKAPFSGIVMMEYNQLKTGDLIAPNANIIEMANDSLSYILVKDDKNQLNYRNGATIKVSNASGINTIQGMVASVNKMCLSKALTNDFSIIAVPQEEMATVSTTTMSEPGRWNRSNIKVSVDVRSEKNVLMVPKTAVKVKDKSTYVTVVNEDGSVENVSFIPGGSDTNYYWIVDGLSEGMTVCWE